jgi:16S rRNA (adenine1518-N6/adenine1519-N6)-dimethyltransferase
MNPRVNPDSPNAIRDALAVMGIALKKRWGQNFMINRAARQRIIEAADPLPGELVWEIGPGLGALTGGILDRGSRVTVFEVDRGLCGYLTEVFGGAAGFSLVAGDFMKTWKSRAETEAPRKVIGNLPFRSASLMIAALVEGGAPAQRMVFTVQKELAERMTARPGMKSYSSFSVLCQAGFETSSIADLRPGNFYPAPDVVSSVVEMRPLPDGPDPDERRMLSEIARVLFASRRKTMRNNMLASRISREFSPSEALALLSAQGIDGEARAQEIPPAAFVEMARGLARLRGVSSS